VDRILRIHRIPDLDGERHPMASSVEHGGEQTRTSMDALRQARIEDALGRPASIVSFEVEGQHARVQAGTGAQVLVPVGLFVAQPDGGYRLPFAFEPEPAGGARPGIIVPVWQEELHVGKRTTDTGRGVRLHKTVSEHEQVIDQPGWQEELQVERVAVGDAVSAEDPPRARYDGDTLVVPVLEEVLVVQKQLRLKEELRITRRRREVRTPQTVTLRVEHVAAERFDEGPQNGPAGTGRSSG
jgi:uncharacterized protein (TIGR02271 family)